MIDHFDQALCALQSATFGRDMYGPDHPQVTTQLARAATLLNTMMAQRPSLSFMAVDDRVIFDDQRLPSGDSLTQGLIARLRQHGIECVTFTQGLTESELSRWIDCFDRNAPSEADQVASTPKSLNTAHIRVGSIGNQTPDEDPEEAAAKVLSKSKDLVRHIFTDPADHVPDLDAVTGLVDHLSTSLGSAAGALLPLASLKHHDEYTSVHTINVAMMATALAQQVGLAAERVHEIAVGAVLHDLGKREVPTDILNKPGRLTDTEFKAIQNHPAAGARALLEMDAVPEAAVIIAYEHHMHLDGTGYPDTRSRTPHLCSQIVQLADIYDALRTHRPYRSAMSLDKATQILQEDAGTKYDADLVQLFFDRVAVRTRPELAEAA